MKPQSVPVVETCEHGSRPILCRECLAKTPNPMDCIFPARCAGLSCCPRERACSE